VLEPAVTLRARSLRQLAKTRAFGMTPFINAERL